MYLRKGILLSGAAAGALLAALVGYDLWRERGAAIKAEGARTRNLALTLSEHARLSFERVNLNVSGAAAAVSEAGGVRAADASYLRLILQERLPLDGLVRAFTVLDAGGALVATTLDGADRGANLAGTEFFRAGREDSGAAPRIARTAKSPFTARWMVPVVQRLAAPDGTFGGVLLAEVEPRHFQAFYGSIDTGRNGFATVFHRGGWILARAPFDEAVLARDWSGAPMFREHLSRSDSGTVRQVVAATGVESLYSYRALKEPPIATAVGISLDDALAGWRERALRDGLALVAVLGLTAALTWLLLRQVALRDAAAREVAAGRAKFENLVGIATDSFWELDAELRFSHVSAGIAGRSGFANYRTVFLGKRRWELPFVDLADPKWDAHRRALEAREPFRDFATGLANDSGETRWFLISGDPVFDDGGRFAGYRGVSQDITERKRADAALRESAARLEALSRRLLVAHEEERQSLARELHDDLGQALTAARIHIQSAERYATDGSVLRERLTDSRAVLDHALDRVRAISRGLRPPQLDDLGLAIALRAHVERSYPGDSPRVALEAEEPLPALPEAVPIACFRIAQEAIHNAVRHGGASLVQVALVTVGGELRVSIDDDGHGFDVEAARASARAGNSIGLSGMEERAQLAGGRFVLRSAPGHGTHVEASFGLGAGGAG